MSGTGDPQGALREVLAEVRAFADQHLEAGTSGLPRGETPMPEPSAVPASTPARAPSGDAPPVDVGATPRAAASARPAAPRAAPPPMEPFAATGDRATRLDVVNARVRECRRCILHDTRTQTVFARGNPDAELCFVGEGPGADEDAQGFPFVGKAGQLLDKMIGAMGYGRDDVYVCNVVKCRPPGNRKPERDEMDACLPYLAEQLGIIAPKVIVALGGTAAEGLLGAPVAITRARGQWRLYRGSIPLMLTYHPAFLLRQPDAKRDAWNDLKAVLQKLGKKPA